MDHRVPNERPRKDSNGDWPKMPGQYPQTSQFQWPNGRQTSTLTKPTSPIADPAVEELLQWRVNIDENLVEISMKLDFLLSETRAFRGMEEHYKKLQEKTTMGTTLANSCRRLDIHQQNIVDALQKLDSTMKQVGRLTIDVDQLKEGNEVIVSIKPGRKE